MSLIAWIVIGLFAGWLAKIVSPGIEPGGFIATLLIGIFGAILFGCVVTSLGFGGPYGVSSFTIAVTSLGSMLCLATWRSLAGTRTF